MSKHFKRDSTRDDFYIDYIIHLQKKTFDAALFC